MMMLVILNAVKDLHLRVFTLPLQLQNEHHKKIEKIERGEEWGHSLIRGLHPRLP